MNILFDLIAAQPEGVLKYHGGSEYAKAVFWAIVNKTTGHLFCIYDKDRYLDEKIKLYCSQNQLPLINIREYKNLNTIIEKYSIRKFYSALPLDKLIQQTLPLKKDVKSIITIHGLRSLELTNDKYELKYLTGISAKLKYVYKLLFPSAYEAGLLSSIRLLIKNYYNPTIITVSDYSKWSLNYFFPELSETPIHVFYSPIINYLQVNSNDSFLQFNKIESKKYFLLLSAGIWQKNSFRILSAFYDLLKNDHLKDYKFVIVGASSLIKEAFSHKSFIYLDYLDRSMLEILLQNAHALIYPSLNEGFGYPPLEAFKYGTGVIASAIGPVIEVCGNAALFFNPYSIMEMKLRILQSINDPGFVSNSQQRIDQFLKIRQRQINDLDSLINLIVE